MPGAQTRGRRRTGAATGDLDTRPRASDDRARRREAAERDAPLERAYNAGHRGDDPAEYQTDDELFQYFEDGRRAAETEGRLERRDELRGAAGARAGTRASDGAGIILGLLAYALLTNYLTGGVAGVKAWMSAKFLNKPTADAAVPRAPGSPG